MEIFDNWQLFSNMSKAVHFINDSMESTKVTFFKWKKTGSTIIGKLCLAQTPLAKMTSMSLFL